jgi:hypothetical protein
MANSSDNKNILFIVEGTGAEPRLLKSINRVIGFNEYEVYAYKTSIYELYDVCEDMSKDDDLDLLLVLKERTLDPNERKTLSRRYASIFLIFDFDPHHQKYELSKIKELIGFFDDSRNNGKLLLSFPMIESHRHLLKMPDRDFLSLVVDANGLRAYKQLVHDTSHYQDIQAYDYQIVSEMIAHHMIKFNHMVHGINRMPDAEGYHDLIANHYDRLVDIQHTAFAENRLKVLSLSFFYIVDIKPKTFFSTRLHTMSL